MEFLTSFLANDLAYFGNLATNIVAGAAVLASVTPTKRDDTFLGKVAKAIDVIGFNFGFARNLEEEVTKVTTAGQKRRRARIDAKKAK